MRSWFSIRGDLPSGVSTLLTACSFLLPLGLWCLVSYVPPFTWHPDVKLLIAGDREGVQTVFTAGDRISASFFPTYREGVIAFNQRLIGETQEPLSVSNRDQLLVLRHLGFWGREQGHLTRETQRDDAALFQLWGAVAEGRIPATRLSSENLDIIRHNWQLLAPFGPEYQRGRLPEQPLLRLIPQGSPANPIYLPAPHEVVRAGWRIFTEPPAGSQPTMWARLGHSLTIVFGGFFIAAAIGVPLGVLAGTFPACSRLIEPFTDFFRYLPAPVFSTLLVAIFAAGDAPKIAMVFLGTFFQMILMVAKTTRQVDRSLLEAAQTLGASNTQLLGRVIIPGILPNLYNDLRILLGWAWTWLVIAELVGVKTGLTDFIDTQGTRRNFDRVYPVILLIGVVGFTTDQLLAFCRPYLFPYAGERQPGLFARILFTVPAAPVLLVAWGRRELRQRRQALQEDG
ncbi:MAG: ABC transporter permease [Planctomycetota bacterium]|nr:MAG: ABC transporter permease [Planctomycetota bacterium]